MSLIKSLNRTMPFFIIGHNLLKKVNLPLYLLTTSEVITGKSQTEALTDLVIARSIHQGQGLRFPCND